ncbi:MAG: LytTR family DNA-binding domain-containing protein [Sphingomicrobium sp.]
MASAAPHPLIERVRTAPQRGPALIAAIVIVWVAGAAYCSGYEALQSGFDNWPGSLLWSAAAVLPWLALFEWSKTAAGQRTTRRSLRLAMALIATAAASLALEFGIDVLSGHEMATLGLSLLRRLPAIGACLLLILWSRARLAADEDAARDESLSAMAQSIDWVSAADNYVELHIAGRTLMRRMTLRQAEQALAAHGFIRIHRRFLVNRARIDRFGSDGERMIRLADGGELPVGRAFAANLNRPG